MRQDRMKNKLQEEMLRTQMVRLLPRMRRFARSLVRDPEKADDLVQAACERALSRLNQVHEGTRLDSWLYRILYTRWIDRLRRGKTRSDHLVVLSNENRSKTAPADIVAGLETALDIKRALKALPEENLAAITLVSVEGYTYAEAAEVMGVPAGTVASRVARARTVLSRVLFHGQRRSFHNSGNIRIEGKK